MEKFNYEILEEFNFDENDTSSTSWGCNDGMDY